MNTRAWRWAPLLVVAVGALSSGCIELPDKAFSCEQDEDCANVGGAGAPYVCRGNVCVQPVPGDCPDAGLDGGSDAGGGACTQVSALRPGLGDEAAWVAQDTLWAGGLHGTILANQ